MKGGRRTRRVTVRRGDGAVLCERCLVADTFMRRLRGLLGRRELAPDEGVVLRPASSVHTMFMRFPIDVVFVDRERTILRVVPRLRPWRAAVCRGARDVVELAEGECARRGFGPGDRLVLSGTG